MTRPEKAIHRMIGELYHRIVYVMPKKASARNRAWFDRLLGQSVS